MTTYSPALVELALARLIAKARIDTPAIRTDEDLAAWLAAYLGVVLPGQACCADHTPPANAFADAYFARAPLAVWHASRGFGGKSYLLAALGIVEAATLGAEVRVLGGSYDQSENVVRYMADWTSRPEVESLIAAGGGQSGITRSRVRLQSGGMVDALAASSRAVRGPHPQRLRIDEADELDLRLLNDALGQPMTRDGVPAQVVISSTHHYPQGTMTDVLRRAGQLGWPVYRWCFRCTTKTEANPTGWLPQSEVDRKRGYIPAAMWQAEYELQEPSHKSRAFAPEAVDILFDDRLGDYVGYESEYVETEAPDPDGWYTTGCDWAKEVDYTVIVTLRCDVVPARVVAFERFHRLPWPLMVKRFDARVERYEGVAVYDATGIGNVVADLVTVGATPFIMSGTARRTDMLSQYLVAVEGGRIIGPRVGFAHNEHRLASMDDLFGRGHLPDSVCAMALAWYGAASRISVQWV